MKNSTFILFIIFFFLLLTLTKSQYSSYLMDLDSYEQRCLNEYYKTQTVIIYEVKSESKNILSEVKSPTGHILYHYVNSTNVFSFTTQFNGFYNFCVQNLGKTNAEIVFVVKSGISANDLSSVAKSKDLEPIDYELDKILKKERLLNHLNEISQEKRAMFGFLYTSISNRIIFCSVLLIVGMIAIGVIEALYLKRFMERRKII